MKKTVTVVGLLDDRTAPSSSEALYGMPGAFTGHPAIEKNPQAHIYLPNTVIDWKQVKKLNAQGVVVLSRNVLEHPPAPGTYTVISTTGNSVSIAITYAAMLVFFAILEVTLLAGAAFTVSAKAQERSLATVASVGSSRSTVFSIVTTGGLVLGAIGGIVGIGVGIAGGSLFMGLTDDGSATRYWGYHLWWPVMIFIAIFAMLVGWLGALVPAIRASRFDVVAALRGARRPPVQRKHRPIFGVILFLLGAALTIAGGALTIWLTEQQIYNNRDPLWWVAMGMLLCGPVLAQLGLILCSGLVLRVIARILSRFSVAARLASRDAARNPGRSVPALAVIMTTVFAAVLVMAMMSSSQATDAANYQYNTMPGQVTLSVHYWDPQSNKQRTFTRPDDLVGAVRENLNVGTVRTLDAVPQTQAYPEPTSAQAKLTPNTLLPALDIPVSHQCPFSPLSANFVAAPNGNGSRAAREAASDPRCQSQYLQEGDGQKIMVGNATDLALVLGAKPSAAAESALANGGAVSLYPEYVAGGHVSVSWWTAKQWETAPRIHHVAPAQIKTIDAVVDKPAAPLSFGIFISEATANTLGLHYEPAVVLASPKTPPTSAQLDSLDASVNALVGVPGALFAQVETRPRVRRTHSH